jgi:DNA-directed RNA polymerase specialized sigma24 family protein
MYREARRKAKIARNLALSSYLDAKRIKNTYMLEDIDDSEESDLDLEDLENENDENNNNESE